MKTLRQFIEDQKREIELNKHIDRIFPEVITPKQVLPNKGAAIRRLVKKGYKIKEVATLFTLSTNGVKYYLYRSYKQVKE